LRPFALRRGRQWASAPKDAAVCVLPATRRVGACPTRREASAAINLVSHGAVRVQQQQQIGGGDGGRSGTDTPSGRLTRLTTGGPSQRAREAR
jgi:hypothetical protein